MACPGTQLSVLNQGHVSRKPRELFGPAGKAICSKSVSKNRAVYTPETSCMKRTSVHFKNMSIKQLRYHKGLRFCYGFLVRSHFGTFEKRASNFAGELWKSSLTQPKPLKKTTHFQQEEKKNAIRRKKRRTSREKK